MDVVPDLPADAWAAEPVDMGAGSVHHPAFGAESGVVLDVASGNARFDTQVSGEAPVLVVVVTEVGEHCVPAASRSPRPGPVPMPCPADPARVPWHEERSALQDTPDSTHRRGPAR